MQRMKWLFTITLILIAGCICAQPMDQRCIQEGDSACVDWDNGVVMAEGLGAPSSKAKNKAQQNATALRAARLDAARNMLEMIKGINLSSTTTMRDAMVTSDKIRTKVQGKLFGLRPSGKPRYFSDGSVSIMMAASLRQTIPSEAMEMKVETEPPRQIRSEESSVRSGTKLDPDLAYTGLVIDAQGIEVQPAMSPKIFDEKGNELYGSAYVDQEFFQKHGMAGYVKNLEQAISNDRVKGNPAILKALSSSGANRTDLILANEDGVQLLNISKNLNFLREARVVIVLD